MKKKIFAVLIILVGVGAFVFWRMTRTAPVTADCQRIDSNEIIITYQSDESFSPACVIIKPGTKVAWKNSSNAALEVGADPHPAHTGNREVSNGEFDLDVKPGEQATVTLTTVGIHGYHNHEHFSSKGVIKVE